MIYFCNSMINVWFNIYLNSSSFAHYASLLTCSSFSLGEIHSSGFPSRFIQDVERVVDLGVRRVERAQAADGADDGHVLVNQWCHALAVQVTAVAIVTWQKKSIGIEFSARNALIIWFVHTEPRVSSIGIEVTRWLISVCLLFFFEILDSFTSAFLWKATFTLILRDHKPKSKGLFSNFLFYPLLVRNKTKVKAGNKWHEILFDDISQLFCVFVWINVFCFFLETKTTGTEIRSSSWVFNLPSWTPPRVFFLENREGCVCVSKLNVQEPPDDPADVFPH